MSHAKNVIAALVFLVAVLSVGAIAWTDIKVNQDVNSETRNEPTVAVNKNFTGDLLNIVAAYNDLYHPLGISYSPDSGYTWFDTQLDSVWSWTGDPSIVAGADGALHACFLSYEGPWFYGVSGIYVCHSFDGGRTWSSPPTVVDQLQFIGPSKVKFADKCMMTIDTIAGGPYENYMYVAWQRDDTLGQNSDIYFSRSTDGGLNFTTPVKVNDNPPQTAFAEGAFPFVGANGDVYVAWYDCHFKAGVPGSLYVDISTDGGQTFGADIKVANFDAPLLYTCACTGFKAKCFPNAAADPNDPSKLYMTYISDPDGYPDIRIDVGDDPGRNQSDMPQVIRDGNYVYAAWQDYRNGAGDIYFNRSTDGGRHWQLTSTGPLDVTDSPGANNSWWQRLANSGNHVYCVWEDFRFGSGPDIYFNRSTNNGQTWQTDVHVDNVFGVSYTPHIAATGSYVYTVFSDARNGLNDIFCARSTDNGATWQPAIRVDNGDTPGSSHSANPFVACSGQYVYCMWIDERSGAGTYLPYFNYSTNYGATWQGVSTKLNSGSPTFATSPATGGLACSGSWVYALWTDDRSGINELYFNRSGNNGQTWSGDVRINDPGFTCNMPDILVDGSYVYVVWHDDRMTGGGMPFNVFFDYSSNNGVAWQMPDIGPLDPGSPAMQSVGATLASDGNHVYATWYDERFGPGMGQVFFNRSTNRGATWGFDVHISTGSMPFGLQHNVPVIDADNGGVNVLWPDPRCVFMGGGLQDIFSNYSTDYGANWLSGPDEADVFCVRSTDGGSTWGGPVTVNEMSDQYQDMLPAVAVKSDGTVDIAYYNFGMSPSNPMIPAGKVRMSVSTDGGQSFTDRGAIQDTIVPHATKWVGEYIGISVLDSFAYVVFTDLAQTGNSDIFIDRSVNPAGPPSSCGDVNSSGGIDIDDIVYLIAYVFQGGPAPIPTSTGDVNCSTGVDIDDIVYLIAYVFQSGNSPCDPDGNGIPNC